MMASSGNESHLSFNIDVQDAASAQGQIKIGPIKGNKSKSSCCVPLCTKTGYMMENGEKVTFHKFPQQESRKRTWIVKIRRDEGDTFSVKKSTRICSRHFTTADFLITPRGRKFVKVTATPSIFPWTKTSIKRNVTLFHPSTQASRGIILNKNTDSSTDSPNSETFITEVDVLMKKVEDLEKKLHLQNEAAEFFQKERDLLRTILQTKSEEKRHQQFSIERFKLKDSDICFYTGFPTFKSMSQCFHLLDPGPNGENMVSSGATTEQKKSARQKLSLMDQFFLTMIRLRLGTFELHLAHLFNVSISTVNRNLTTWINFMYLRLGSINIWPSKETIIQTMPESMKAKYPNLEWIIDAFEIQCERPSSLMLQSQSYSNYKSRNTLKGLVACTPSGQIGFISRLYLGSISDRELTVRSGFLEQKHNKGTMWLVDKGFQIQDLVDKLGVTVNMPAFVGKKGQLSAEEVYHTQVVASERIHIERAINKIKNFHIFAKPIPLSTMRNVNQEWTVCALLTLFQNPIISA